MYKLLFKQTVALPIGVFFADEIKDVESLEPFAKLIKAGFVECLNTEIEFEEEIKLPVVNEEINEDSTKDTTDE